MSLILCFHLGAGFPAPRQRNKRISRQAAGVIGRYAIGGAVGATFYLEPMPTMDVDVFVAILPEAGSLIITPKPIYDYLTKRGYTPVGEALQVESKRARRQASRAVADISHCAGLLEESIASPRGTLEISDLRRHP